jgi:AcrR family transcriptional regulator
LGTPGAREPADAVLLLVSAHDQYFQELQALKVFLDTRRAAIIKPTSRFIYSAERKDVRHKGGVLDKRVRAVTEAAAELFSTRGFLETSMDEIAKAAHLSKGGMYHYFKGKTEILLAILSDFMDQVLGDIEGQLETIRSPESKLSFLIRRHVEIYVRHMHAARILLKESYNLPSKDLKKINEKERHYYRVVEEVIRQLLGPRAGKDVLTAVTFSLLGMCNWIYSWYDPKGRIDPERLSEIIMAIFTEGVRGVGAKAESGPSG